MNLKKILLHFGKFHAWIRKKSDQYITKQTERFINDYELKFEKKPSVLRVQKFRKDFVLKMGLVAFIILTFVYFMIIPF